MRASLAAACVVISVAGPVVAQETVWVQVEARPTLQSAEERVRDYASRLPDVAGFALGGGWYGVALGPYDRSTANQVLQDLRRAGQIPSDAYVALTNTYRAQFYPIGANALQGAPRAAPEIAPLVEEVTAAPEAPITQTTEADVVETPPAPDETLREARASERLLSRPEREKLQVALKWAGVYKGGIDGAFGRGTRGAMAAWQEQNALEATGVLTTAQRAALLAQYNAILDGLGLQRVTDAGAGITMKLPTALVDFDRYEAPFAHYEPKAGSKARVILISQQGGQDRFTGLYNVLQTLDILPIGGPRSNARGTFTIEGSTAERSGYAYATLAQGEIKGFILEWPTGDEERRTRLLDEMRESFEVTPGFIDPALGRPPAEEQPDLLAGLEYRTPLLTRSGFYVDGSGTVVTAADAVGACGRVTLGGDETAVQPLVVSEDLGVALLTAKGGDVPLSSATFQTTRPRLQSDVSVAGFSYGGALGAPSLTFGTLVGQKGLKGEDTLVRLNVSALPGDAGGPVFDSSGAVIGVLLPQMPVDGRLLPPEVHFAAYSDALTDLLETEGVRLTTTDQSGSMDAVDLAALSQDMMVTVNCWE